MRGVDFLFEEGSVWKEIASEIVEGCFGPCQTLLAGFAALVFGQKDDVFLERLDQGFHRYSSDDQ